MKADDDDIWARLDERDFQGRTSFAELSVEQRLLWLSQAAAFAIGMRRPTPTAPPTAMLVAKSED